MKTWIVGPHSLDHLFSVYCVGEFIYAIGEDSLKRVEDQKKLIYPPFQHKSVEGDTKEQALIGLFEAIVNDVVACQKDIEQDLEAHVFILKDSLKTFKFGDGAMASVTWACIFGEITHIPTWVEEISWPEIPHEDK